MEKSSKQSAQILDAAYRCLARDGYAQVSLRQVAAEADVAVSQLSYYYGNKKGLLLAVVARAAQTYHTKMQDHLSKGTTPQEKGRAFIGLFQDILEKEPQLFRVLYDLAGLALWSDAFKHKVKELFADIIHQVAAEVFGPEVTQEAIRPIHPETLSRILLGSLFGISIQTLLQPEQGDLGQSLDVLAVLFENRR